MRIKLPRPHSDGQLDLITSTQNDVVFAGRRWGKTHTGTQRIIRAALNDKGLYWWVGLGWKSASLKRAWRELKTFATDYWTALGEKPEKHIRESSKELDLPGGSEIWMRTAERPDSLAGEGIKGCVLDEFTLMQEIVWTEYVEATLLDHNGWAMFIGVPKGNNWGAKLWKNCGTPPLDASTWHGQRKGWAAHHFPTSSNPFISPERLEDIRRNTPQGLFEQEYLAVVIEHAGLVFKNYMECCTSKPENGPADGHNYVFGLDWGKSNDFTCIPVIDIDEKRLVHFERFNDIDYNIQLQRVKQLYNNWQPRNIVAESNSMGEPLCDQLINDGLPITKYFMTNKSKREVIEALQVAFEQKEIGIYHQPDLIRELGEFEQHISPSGNIRYSAPDGAHDDCVISLALAWNEIRYDLGISF